jgi:hypothetical protein
VSGKGLGDFGCEETRDGWKDVVAIDSSLDNRKPKIDKIPPNVLNPNSAGRTG